MVGGTKKNLLRQAVFEVDEFAFLVKRKVYSSGCYFWCSGLALEVLLGDLLLRAFVRAALLKGWIVRTYLADS